MPSIKTGLHFNEKLTRLQPLFQLYLNVGYTGHPILFEETKTGLKVACLLQTTSVF